MLSSRPQIRKSRSLTGVDHYLSEAIVAEKVRIEPEKALSWYRWVSGFALSLIVLNEGGVMLTIPRTIPICSRIGFGILDGR